MKNILKKVSVLLIVTLTLIGCTDNGGEGSNNSENTNGESDAKVAVVVNQRFGDKGPMDNLLEGLELANEDFNIEYNTLESASAANFEEDVRAMAGADYDLVVTTFAYMSDATKIVAGDHPDTNFAAIFQDINSGEEKFDNIWDSQFHGEHVFYLAGYLAGLTTESNNIGLLIGGEEPTPNAEGNAFMQGVSDSNPDATVQFSFIGSYEDPAKAREIANAMISSGADYLQANAGASNAGVVEAAQTHEVLVAGEITDFYEQYEGFTGIVEIGFGQTIYDAIEMQINGEFPGGEQGIRDITNGGYTVNWETYERFSENNEIYGEAMAKAIDEVKILEEKIISDELEIEFDPSVPRWENYN